MVDILSRIGIVERASIDECYLDLTEESHSRLAACSGQPNLPVSADRVHICGQVGPWMLKVAVCIIVQTVFGRCGMTLVLIKAVTIAVVPCSHAK